ncbi:HdeD family acid-resistance protein [Nocardioides sp.]|uniref:HdeD family acid-resistance protein n=1 Tax=Nocardioides sp. TaxID=35761 RepID=UPI003527F5C3
MSDVQPASKSLGDWILGGLLVVVGLVLLGNATFATAVSVLFIAWMTFISGVVTLVFSLVRVGTDGSWTGVLGGGLMTALGLVMLRNSAAVAFTLTLVAGTMFFMVGVARLAVAGQVPELRVPLIISGGVSLVLGLIVLFNVFTFTPTLLGVLLGIQVLVEGLSILVMGRAARAYSQPV